MKSNWIHLGWNRKYREIWYIFNFPNLKNNNRHLILVRHWVLDLKLRKLWILEISGLFPLCSYLSGKVFTSLDCSRNPQTVLASALAEQGGCLDSPGPAFLNLCKCSLSKPEDLNENVKIRYEYLRRFCLTCRIVIWEGTDWETVGHFWGHVSVLVRDPKILK